MYSSPPEYPPSASLLKRQDTTHRDGVQREWGRPSTAASQSRIPLLFASLFAVSAMIFLVYLCSLLMKKRITRPSSARRLAASWGREKCDEFGSSNTEFRASASSEEQQGLQDASVQLFPGLTPVEELIADTEYTPSLEVTAGASALVFPAETTGQVTTDGEQASLKRRLDESFGEEDWGKMLILDMPHGEGPLQPAPPLDPEFDAFIDTVLFGGEDPFAELGWLPSDEPQNTEPLGLSLGSWPTASSAAGQDGSALLSTAHEGPLVSSRVAGPPRKEHNERIIVRQVPDPGPSGPPNLPRGSAAEVAAGTSGLDGRAPAHTMHEGPSTSPLVPIILRRGPTQGTSDKQEPHPGPSTPQNIPRGQAAARLPRIAPAATPVGGAVLLQQHHSIILLSSPTATAAVPQMPLPAGTTVREQLTSPQHIGAATCKMCKHACID